MLIQAVSAQITNAARPLTGMARHRPLALSLILLIMCGVSALAGAQTGPEPGATDPVGPPASYITLRSDDLGVARIIDGQGGPIFQTYGVDNQSKLSSQLTTATGPSATALAASFSASGRILGQDNDQVVTVSRNLFHSNLVSVLFPLGGTAYLLPNLHAAIPNTPDLIKVAAGDLDKVPDENGINHDEVVVAYGQDSSNGNYNINLAVLNYTSTQAVGTNPRFVTQIQTPYPVEVSGYRNVKPASPVSDLFSVAIGDFDGDGENEIAVATLGAQGSSQVNLSIFRYVHNTLNVAPTLELATSKTFRFVLTSKLGVSNLQAYANFQPTISLIAGDFAGTGKKAELVLALQNRPPLPLNPLQVENVLQVIEMNANLEATLKARQIIQEYTVDNSLPLTAGKVVALAGLFKYDPAAGFDLYRREVALVYNERQPAINDRAATLNVKGFVVSRDLSSIQPLFPKQAVQNLVLPDAGVGAKFEATAGGLAVDANLATPLWSLAISQLQNGSMVNTVTTVRVGAVGVVSLSPASVTTFTNTCCSATGSDNNIRPAVQAYDYRGRTVFLGAPIRIAAHTLINTDFVLQEPPKHAYWDEAAGVLNNISRFPTIAASLTTEEGNSFAAKSTDMSAASLGGSVAISASQTTTANVGLGKVTTSIEGTAKASYNYETNESSYNSQYGSRTLTETASTDNDDFISGLEQDLDIWRYRVFGVSSQDQNGKSVNTYYDVVLPGPTLNFKASGLDVAWYQPLHENGNILSYPATGKNFSPPDLGTYSIPCTSGAKSCTDINSGAPCSSGATNCFATQSGAIIPLFKNSISNTSSAVSVDYSGTNGSGTSFSYEHKESTSLDIKQSYSVEIGTAPAPVSKTSASIALNFNQSNSWGNTVTSDITTTAKTGIKISRSAIDSSKAYDLYPVVYATLDGTIKVAYAANPPTDVGSSSFWNGLYGKNPDPALNLPLRFIRSSSSTTNSTIWIPNTLISRKLMRGFFLMTPAADLVTGEYDILAQAPIAGDKVRLSAQVYNYSTGQSFSNCLVQFYAIKYDSTSDTESGGRTLIGSTTISLPPRGTAPAQIIWNTTGFGPAGASGGQGYRIYVDLNYDKAINEIYPPEDPMKDYASGLPLGIDPGQNNEGWGLATVMAPASAQSTSNSQSAALFFGATPLAIVRSGNLFTQNLAAQSGAPTELRAEVCASSSNSRDPVDVLVFDGVPAEGNVIAWRTLYVPNQNKCEGTWFNWTPTSGKHHLVATILSNNAPQSLPNNAVTAVTTSESEGLTEASLAVNVP